MNTETELAEDRLTHHEATQLTERIRLKVGTIQDNIDALAALVTRAKNGEADVVLGYKSWTAYIVDCVGSDPLDLTRAERKKLVGFLASEGMSTRAIAPVVGVDHSTVVRDQLVQDAPVQRPATVTSLDGYQRPAVQPPRAPSSEPERPERQVNVTVLDPAVEERRQQRDADQEAEYWREQARRQWNDFLIRSSEFFAFDAVRCAGDYDPAKYGTKPMTSELFDQAADGLAQLRKELSL